MVCLQVSYTVLSAGEDHGQCNCPQGLQGAFCKHRVAVLLQLGQKPFHIFEKFGINHGAAELAAPTALAANSMAAAAVSAPAEDAAGSEAAAAAEAVTQRGRRALTAQDRFQQHVLDRLASELALEPPTSDWWVTAQRLLEPGVNSLIAMRTTGALIGNLSYGGSTNGSGLADADVTMSQSQRHGAAAAPIVQALVANPSAAPGCGAARLRAFFEAGGWRAAAKRPPPAAQQPSAASPERLPLQARQRKGSTKTQQRSLAAMVNKKGVDGEEENQPLATASVPQPVAPQPSDQASAAVLSQMTFTDLMQI